jgi:hypothetical protein
MLTDGNTSESRHLCAGRILLFRQCCPAAAHIPSLPACQLRKCVWQRRRQRRRRWGWGWTRAAGAAHDQGCGRSACKTTRVRSRQQLLIDRRRYATSMALFPTSPQIARRRTTQLASCVVRLPGSCTPAGVVHREATWQLHPFRRSPPSRDGERAHRAQTF